MLTYTTPEIDEFDRLFDLMRAEASEYLEDSLWSIGMTVSAFRAKFKSVGEVVEVLSDGDPAGFYWVEARDNILHLHGLILKSEYQGRGLGRQIMQAIEKIHSEGISAIELGVYHGNAAARKLYDRMGYRVVKSLDDVYFDIMRKTLSHRSTEKEELSR